MIGATVHTSLLFCSTVSFLMIMSLNMIPFWMTRMVMGVKERRTVWRRKIHLPLGEVGLKRQRPLEMEAMSVSEVSPIVVVPPPPRTVKTRKGSFH